MVNIMNTDCRQAINFCALRWLLLIVIFGAALAHAADVTPDTEEIIKLLGSEEFEQREQAQKRLLLLGVKAKDALQKAVLTESDPELLIRAKYILTAILCQELKDSVMKSNGPEYEAEDLEMCKVIVRNLNEVGFFERDAMYRFLSPAGSKMLIQQMKQILRRNPEDKIVAYILGCSFYWQENYDEAITAWSYVEHLDGRYVMAIVGRGRACMHKRKYEESRKAFELAKTLAPGLADPVWYLALLDAETGDFKRALEVWRTSKALKGSDESDLTCGIVLGRLLAGSGDIAGAKNALNGAFKELKSKHPHSPYSNYYPLLIYNEFAKMYEAARLVKEMDQNLADAKKNIPAEKEGLHPDILLMDANARIIHDECQDAIELIKRVILVRGETESLRKLMAKAQAR